MRNIDVLRQGQVSVHRDKVFAIDPSDSDRIDAVFPLCYENRYFVDNLDIREGDLVLDLCTGSGIIAVFAAQKAKRVVATDINSRALEFARCNAALNEVEQKIDFRHGDLFEPANGMKFDAVLANPPFEPVPAGYQYYMHSHGGIDGLRIVLKILHKIDDYINEDGVFQVLTFLPNGDKRILGILSRKFRDVKITELRSFDGAQFSDWQSKRIEKLNIGKPRSAMNHNTLKLVFIRATEVNNGCI